MLRLLNFFYKVKVDILSLYRSYNYKLKFIKKD